MPLLSTSDTGATARCSLVRTTVFSALRSSNRRNCHPPSHQAAYASTATTSANTIQRRLSRNPNERTQGGYPAAAQPPET